MCKPELAYRSDGPKRGTRNEGLHMRSVGKEKTQGPFQRFVRHSAFFANHLLETICNASIFLFIYESEHTFYYAY